MKRYECLQATAGMSGDALVVTGSVVSSEWYFYNPGDGIQRRRTMGLTSSMALGMALGLPRRKVIAVDGDGALLMNLCGLPTIARKKPKNLIHLVFDNGLYESSGGTPTATSDGVDLAAAARATGIKNVFSAGTVDEFKNLFRAAMDRDELTFICAKVEPGRGEAPPWSVRDVENKYRFIRHVEKTEGITILETRVPASMKKGLTERIPAEAPAPATGNGPEANAQAILSGLKRAGINFFATLPDMNLFRLISAIEKDEGITHVPLCREEEGVAISAGAYMVGKKPALVMLSEGLLNSCNAIVTTAIQLEIPMLLVVYFAGDIGDQGFARSGGVLLPVLDALGVRHYILRETDEIEWTFRNARILCDDLERPVAVLLTKDVLGTRS